MRRRPTVELLIALRALQGIADAAVLVCAFELLRAGEPEHRRVWVRAAVLGTAVGPALGGAVTELFDWRAIFLIQAPVVAACAVACRRAAPSGLAVRAIVVPGRVFGGRELALGLLAAALTGVLFLLVLLLISGWALSPLAAAAVVSILPAAGLRRHEGMPPPIIWYVLDRVAAGRCARPARSRRLRIRVVTRGSPRSRWSTPARARAYERDDGVRPSDVGGVLTALLRPKWRDRA